MKKSFLVLAIAATTAMAATATYAKDIKVKSGDKSILKENAKVYLEFDYSTTTWEEDESFKDFCGDKFEYRIENAKQKFCTAFNYNSKGILFTEDLSGVKYKCIIHLDNFERKVGALWGSFYIKMWGRIEFMRVDSNETICAINIKGLDGGDHYVPDIRFLSVLKRWEKNYQSYNN